MMNKLWLRVALFFVLAMASRPVLAQDKLTRVRIAYPSGGICCLALYGGIQWKIFEENGLHVEIVQIRSQVGNMALMANEIQYFSGVGPASVSATLRGMPSRGVWFASDQLIYSLMARLGDSNPARSAGQENRHHRAWRDVSMSRCKLP